MMAEKGELWAKLIQLHNHANQLSGQNLKHCKLDKWEDTQLEQIRRRDDKSATVFFRSAFKKKMPIDVKRLQLVSIVIPLYLLSIN